MLLDFVPTDQSQPTCFEMYAEMTSSGPGARELNWSLSPFFGQMGRNPIQSAGCYGILKSIRENPDSSMETLDFAVGYTHICLSHFIQISFLQTYPLFVSRCFQDITVNQEFEDLYTAVKETFPALTVNHGGRVGTFRKAKAWKVLL